MITVVGALLLAMGLASGVLLVLAPFGVGPPSPGVTTWLLFPGFTIVGYILLAASARMPIIALASRLGGALLLLLAFGAAAALFAIGNALYRATGDSMSLWYVMGFGFILGVAGFAIGRAIGAPRST
ncbi:MAG TPA: hypothetical protein VMN79_05475 [Casimicrobiaceae bacterium]|nr:hypothetical protein [Casimicrobiaceae bacterium]